MLKDRFGRFGVIIAHFLRLIGRPFYILLVSIVALAQLGLSALLAISTRLYAFIKVQSLHIDSVFKNVNELSLPTPNLVQRRTLAIWHYFLDLLKASRSLSVRTTRALVQLSSNVASRITAVFTGQPRRFVFSKITLLRLGLTRFRSRLIHIQVPAFFTSVILWLGFFFICGGLFYGYILKDLPHPKELVTQPRPVTTKIYDRNHRLLYKIYQEENRSLVTLDELPDFVIKSTLAIEDSDFYNHSGFSLRGIARALSRNTTTNSLQGGSTITQQLVKNVLLSSERTYTRKLKELVLAISVESYFTKDEILNMYLNQVGYGGTAYGIEEASQLYFGKSAWELSLPEAALLAGLPAAPTTYSPFGVHPELALQRQAQVLQRMREEGYISESLAEKALAIPLEFTSPKTDIIAPHFVMYVRELLVSAYGEARVSQGGLTVVTSLDRDIQELAEAAVAEELDKLTSLNVTNAAVMVTNPNNGDILAMVGSHDYFDTEQDGQVNVALRPRQPGSSIKPVTYALALEHDFTAGTIIDDSPITYKVPGSPPYSPKNYDGRFHGKVTVRQALANSYNIPAVKTLQSHGVANMIDLGEAMGIQTWGDRSRFGLALTLGGGEVTLYDMMSVYGTLAHYGSRVPLHPIVEVSDFSGSQIGDYSCKVTKGTLATLNQALAVESPDSCQGMRVIAPTTAYILSDILSDNKARTPSFGSASVLVIPGHQVAVKTGTTNSLRDNWTLGYTQDYVVGVWVGNNNNTAMSRVASGITGASPIWNTVMSSLVSKREESHRFTVPRDLVKVAYCPLTKTLSCGSCPNPTTEYFLQGTEPKVACSQELIDRLLEPPIAQD